MILSKIILHNIISPRGNPTKKFINRERELAAFERQYTAQGASFMVIYGCRRVGITTLIREFIKSKPAFYFLAREENEALIVKNHKR